MSNAVLVESVAPQKPFKAPKLRMLDDRILIMIDEEEHVTPGGILLPDTAKEKPRKGTVISVGPGKFSEAMYAEGSDNYHVPPGLKQGDKVLFTNWAGNPVPGYDGFVIMRADDVLAVIEDE